MHMAETNLRSSGAISGCGPLKPSAQEQGRKLKLQVFDFVRAAGLIARMDVARELSISPGSVSTITAELIEAGFINEVDVPRRNGGTGRGRPPVALGVRGNALCVVGINLSDRRHTAMVVDLAGNRIGDASIDSTSLQHSFDDIPDIAANVLQKALSNCGKSRPKMIAVGLGLPGLVDHQTGIVPWSPIIQERDVPMREALTAIFGCPVVIDNDANLVTLAELWFGAGRSLKDFASVTIEHGIGMGMVLDHQLYRGSSGLGTELGHTKVQLDGALCRCGQRGCLEAYIADYALVREASTALNLGNHDMTSPDEMLKSLYESAKAGNETTRAIFHRAGRYLALGLANVVNVFDPPLILLSGERMQYDYLYAEEVLTEMSNLTLQSGRPLPKVEIHAWGGLLWAQGAAALALEYATDAAINAGIEKT